MNLLSNDEKKLSGKWIYQNGYILKDEVSERIEWLVNNHLIQIGTDISGWDSLYFDPVDSRYWELTYPESELQGGGPPNLNCISKYEAKKKYPSLK